MKPLRIIPLMFMVLLVSHFFENTGHARDEYRFIGSIKVKEKNKKDFPDLAKISFQQVLDLISKSHPGKIIEVALEEEDGFLVYEVEMISSEQTKKEIILDAGTGTVLLVKEKKIQTKTGN